MTSTHEPTTAISISGRNYYLKEGIEVKNPTFEHTLENFLLTMNHTTSEQTTLENMSTRATIIDQLLPRKYTVMYIDGTGYRVYQDQDGRMFYYVAPYYSWEQTHMADCRCRSCIKLKKGPYRQVGIRNNSRTWQPTIRTSNNIRSKTVNPKDTYTNSRQSSRGPNSPNVHEETPYSPPPINSPNPSELTNHNWDTTDDPFWGCDNNPDWESTTDITRELLQYQPKTPNSNRLSFDQLKERNRILRDTIPKIVTNWDIIIPTLPAHKPNANLEQLRRDYNKLTRAEEILQEVKEKKTNAGQAHREWKLFTKRCEHGMAHYHASVKCWSCSLVEIELDNPTKSTF